MSSETRRPRLLGDPARSSTVEATAVTARVVALSPPCGACPTEWFGATAAGEAFFVRYRYGVLSVTVGDGTPVARLIYNAQVGSALDGVLGTHDMQRHLAGAVEFAPILEDHAIPAR
jgi:hypothetical protein